jgi:hypothetical protein
MDVIQHCDAYLVKPVKMADLISLLKRFGLIRGVARIRGSDEWVNIISHGDHMKTERLARSPVLICLLARSSIWYGNAARQGESALLSSYSDRLPMQTGWVTLPDPSHR